MQLSCKYRVPCELHFWLILYFIYVLYQELSPCKCCLENCNVSEFSVSVGPVLACTHACPECSIPSVHILCAYSGACLMIN